MIKVSSEKANISPRGKFFPCSIHRGKLAEEIADELYAAAMVLEIEEKPFIWLVLDLGGIDKDFSDKVRDKLSQLYDTEKSNIIIGFSHTHSSPPLHSMKGMFPPDNEYIDYIADKILDVVSRCYEKGLKEVGVYQKQYVIDGYYGNRISKDSVGDKEFRILEFRDKNDVVVAVCYNFACHATVVGPYNRYITADLVGYISRGLEADYGVYPLAMMGAGGNMSNRLYRQGHDYKELIRVGEGILKQLRQKVEAVRIAVSYNYVDTYRFQEVFTQSKEDKETAIRDIKEKIAKASTPDLKRVFSSSLHWATSSMDVYEMEFDCEGHIYQLGDLMMVTMPAELFCQFGLELKKAMNVKAPIFWGYNNYTVGYLFNREEAGTSFESMATFLPVGMTEDMVDKIIVMMKEKRND